MELKNIVALAVKLNAIMKLTGKDCINTKATERSIKGEIRVVCDLLKSSELAEFTKQELADLLAIGAKLPKVTLTAEQKAAAKDAKEAEKAEKAARKAAGNYTRSHAMHDALCHGGTKDECIKLADKLFFEKHPAHKIPKKNNVARDMFQYATPLAIINGSVTVTGTGESKVYQDTASKLLATVEVA
jgi:hypothetical protein